MRHLSAILVTKAERALAAETIGPETSKINVGLWDPGVGNEEPDAEDWLRKKVENSVGDDFGVHRDLSSSVGDSPNNRVGSPDKNSETSNGNEERANLLALGLGLSASIDGQVPNNDKVGNTSDRVPAPLLGSTLSAESSEKSSQDHDNVGNDSHGDVGAIEASEQAEIEEKKGRSQCPVNVSGPVNLTLHLMECVGDVFVLGSVNSGVD